MSSVVLVTGGSGFIGSHVVDRLVAAGHRPRIFDVRPSPWHGDEVETVLGDLRALEDVRRAVAGCDAVCHLAAAADVNEVQAAPASSTELNAQGTLNVLEAARLEGVRRVVYASTVWVYSDVDADVVDEDTALFPPAHLYTAGKLSGELFCRSYAELYDLEPTITRFGIPYGPRARPAAVIPSFVARAQAGETVTIAGSGEQERSFVYVEDLAQGVVDALAPHAAGRTYNLAGTETTTIRGLADIVGQVVAPVEIVHTPGRAGDLKGATIDSSRAERELGWRASTPLRDGVRRYAEWVREEAEREVAPAVAPARVGRPLAALRDLAHTPAFASAIALIAVISATIAVVLSAREERPAAALAVLGATLLLPLWTLAAVDWPRERRELQRRTTVAFGAFSVLLLGLLAPSSELHVRQLATAVVVSALLSTALWVVPRRLVPARA